MRLDIFRSFEAGLASKEKQIRLRHPTTPQGYARWEYIAAGMHVNVVACVYVCVCVCRGEPRNHLDGLKLMAHVSGTAGWRSIGQRRFWKASGWPGADVVASWVYGSHVIA